MRHTIDQAWIQRSVVARHGHQPTSLILGLLLSCGLWVTLAGAAAADDASVTSKAATGEPLGVTAVHIEFPEGDRPRYQPDQTLRVHSADHRVLYPAYHVNLEQPSEADGEQPIDRRLQSVDVYFLFAGDEPPQIRIGLDAETLAENVPVTAEESDVSIDELLGQWWAAYQEPTSLAASEQEAYVRNYLQGMLARRLDLNDPTVVTTPDADESQLEKYFEKATLMMFGFASVNSAIGQSTWSSYSSAELDQSPVAVPEPIQIPSVPVPSFGPVAVEKIAMRVPADCLYVRCRTVDNYFWFRNFLMDWGGSLNQIVAQRTHEAGVRQRLEMQLGLIPDDDGKEILRDNLEDLALIAADPFFEDGAAIGVLFQSRKPAALTKWIEQCRSRIARDTKATETNVSLGRHSAKLLSTPDQRVRSYLAVDGEFVLVTNSANLAARFFPSQGDGSLGATNEFRYARSQCRIHDDQTVFLYLSDPFFRRLASPEFRIELSRRQRSAHELRYLTLAQLAARAEGVKADSVDQLIAGGYLPNGFGRRADDTKPTLVAGSARDSARGVPGTFTPIVDMRVTSATRKEVEEFQEFWNQYNREWRATDPVVVLISHEPQDERERVHAKVKITPYARESYGVLNQHLHAATNQRIVPPENDLLSLGAWLNRQDGETFQLHAGIEDADIKFALHDGELQILTPEVKESFGKTYTYFAYRNGSLRDLLVVRNIMSELGLEADTGDAGAFVAVVDTLFTLNSLRPGNILRSFLPFGRDVIPDAPVDPLDIVAQNWRVIAHTEGVGDSARDELEVEDSSTSAQMRLEMRDINGAKVEPYLLAYCYLQARKASARNARLLDTAMQQFHLSAEQVSPALAKVFGHQLVCPLSGDFQPQGGSPENIYWTSTKWPERSLHDESNVPEDYRFPFLTWLHGLNLEFKLEPTTLHADVDLVVQPTQRDAP